MNILILSRNKIKESKSFFFFVGIREKIESIRWNRKLYNRFEILGQIEFFFFLMKIGNAILFIDRKLYCVVRSSFKILEEYYISLYEIAILIEFLKQLPIRFQLFSGSRDERSNGPLSGIRFHPVREFTIFEWFGRINWPRTFYIRYPITRRYERRYPGGGTG